jgi:hypothetical protein
MVLIIPIQLSESPHSTSHKRRGNDWSILRWRVREAAQPGARHAL